MASREPHCQLSGSKVCFSSKRSMHGSNILTQYKSYRPGRREGKKPCLIRNCSRFSRQICIFCSYRLIRCTMRSWCTNRTRGIHRKINGRHRYCKEVLPRCTPLHVEFYENHPNPSFSPSDTNRPQTEPSPSHAQRWMPRLGRRLSPSPPLPYCATFFSSICACFSSQVLMVLAVHLQLGKMLLYHLT
jgi:hypothetical protein